MRDGLDRDFDAGADRSQGGEDEVVPVAPDEAQIASSIESRRIGL